ncbi:MAG TPA: 3-oxoacyl-[acyl-carrier-protein] synthase III C-terminal domain-containing protein [Elusimicrobiota bacterium]|nr:3-oxoacyl-[acyl-carrier-protein] synthase III C-terminal domain-containing protein [Elusimicrobiota bacterium]HNA61309.1 3-oxoacyl-[acyl-carrier-protein] synthase III C-terminal domain-containing protein [Elusimicrobiota bacterium]
MKLLSVAHAVPGRRVDNDQEIAAFCRRNWMWWPLHRLFRKKLQQGFKLSGTRYRYRRAPGETASAIACRAAREALDKAGLAPGDVDMLIYVGVGRGVLEPATANLFKSLLGLTNATCFDVLDACASWVRGMSIAQSFINQGTHKTVMVMNAELNYEEYCGDHALRRPKDLYFRFAAHTIGEAATATIVRDDGRRDNFYFSMKNWENTYDLCQIPLPNRDDFAGNYPPRTPQQNMVFVAASRELLTAAITKLTEQFKEDPRLNGQIYDLHFCHDVSDYSTKLVAKALNVPLSMVYRTHERFGNTVSASIPLALSLALAEGRLKKGMNLLLTCGSAGVTTAYLQFRYD